MSQRYYGNFGQLSQIVTEIICTEWIGTKQLGWNIRCK